MRAQTVSIEGHLELVDRLQICGWAFDQTNSSHHLEIELLCGGRPLGRTRANLFRRDLEAAGLGGGDHAFVFNCEPPIAIEDLSEVSARVLIPGFDPVALPPATLQPPTALPAAPAQVAFPLPISDTTQHPLFILGGARSGTSAVVRALIDTTSFKGQEEGHFLDVLAPLLVHLDGFYKTKGDEVALAEGTMIARVPESYMRDALYYAVGEAVRQIFPAGQWLEKTPNANMIYLAPRFREIWPNARFIFMKRRGIDNVASRLRKFSYDFAHNCREWAAAMQAWLDVRGQLQDVSIELDQHDIATQPRDAAARIGALIALDETETTRLASALATVRPQRTNPEFSNVKSLDEIGWTTDQIAVFQEICGDLMMRFGYDSSSAYFS